MGVLFVMPNWKSYSETWMQRMIAALDPHIAAIAAYAPDAKKWADIPVIPLGLQPLWRRGAHKLAPLLFSPASDLGTLQTAFSRKDVTCALVHYLDFALKFEEVWQKIDKPVFVHCHGYDVTWNLRYDNPPYGKYFDDGYPAAVRRLSQRAMLIANSHSTASELFEIGVAENRVEVKHLGVPVPAPSQKRSATISNIKILYLGRLVDFKAPNVVIEAFNAACDAGLDGTLTIAGDGELRLMCELMRLRSRYADRIQLLGAVDASEAQDLYEEADIFTSHCCTGPFTQQVEAFGVSIIEAMAAALPVITGRSGGVVETVVHGETGILVEPGNVQAHAEALLLLARDPELRHSMGGAGRQRIQESFSWEQEKAALLRLLNLV